MDDHVARRKRIFGPGMLVVGAVVYPWDCGRCHTLSEKGYFCGNRHVWFSSLNSPEHTGNGRLLSRCKSLLLLGIGMVAVGVFNPALAGALKILCLVALGVSIYGTDLYASYSDDE